MIKLTVLYNLPPGADHEEFMKWRTTTHQKSNMAVPGVIKSDFYEIKRAWRRDETPYRYLTEAYFPDMETFEKALRQVNIEYVSARFFRLQTERGRRIHKLAYA